MHSFTRITGSLALAALLGACGQPMSTEDAQAGAGTLTTGVLEVAVLDYEDSADQLIGLRLPGGELLRLRVRDEQLADFRSGDPIDVRGVRRGDEIDLTEGGSVQSAQEGLAMRRSALVQSGPRTIAVALFNFRNDFSQPVSKQQARSAVFTANTSLAAYYKELSNSATTLTSIADKVNGDAHGYFTIDVDNTNCSDPFGWTNKVDTIAKAQGIDLSRYSHVIYVFPDTNSCSWTGTAQMPGRKTIIKASTIGTVPKVVAHEFGHNLGFAHANVWKCTEGGNAVPLSASCSSKDVGDLLDPMGLYTSRPPMHTNLRNKADAGWMSTRITDVQASGEYTFTAANVASSGAQGLKIARADGSYLWLETRSMTGFDALAITNANHAIYRGVSIRVGKAAGTVTSQLLDATPATASVDDAPFMPGTSLTDAASHITVTVVSVASGTARVRVEL